MVGTGSWGRGAGSECFMGTELLLSGIKKFLGTAAAMAGQAHECTDAAELRLKDGRRDRPVKKEAGRVANRRHSPPAQGAPRSPDRVAPSSWRSPPDPSCGTASLCLLPCGAKGLRCHMAGATAVLDTALLPKLSMVCCVISSACVCVSLWALISPLFTKGEFKQDHLPRSSQLSHPVTSDSQIDNLHF